MATRGICAPDAPVIPEERPLQVRRPFDVGRQDRDTVADVGVHIHQVPGLAAPFAGVKGHDLHQSPRADIAARYGVELRVLGQKETHK